VSDYNLLMDRLDPVGDGPVPPLSLEAWREETGQDLRSFVAARGTWGELFEDLGSWDLRLREESRAIDAGGASIGGVEAPADDAVGTERPSGVEFDVGAYERPVGGCAADFNADGEVTSQDFFDFLEAFFDQRADFNRDGVTTSQDFFDFLGAFFEGCG
jgi:hypothetical protein